MGNSILMKKSFLFVGIFVFMQSVQSQISYTWNGVISTAWNVPGNWTPNGIPGAADNITIVAGGNTCLLNAAASITNITINSGILDLGGFTLTTGGATALFSAGLVQNGTMTVSGATTTTLGNGPVTMNCAVNITSATVTLRNTIFQNTTNITKTGAANDVSVGNNTFNGATTITNAGAGYLMLASGSPDQFNTTATFNNTGSNNLYVAYNSTNNVFGGVTTFNNTPTANTLIEVSWLSANTNFKDNIIVSSSGGQGVQFCGGNAAAATVLSAAKTISVGVGGFSAGTLLLKQFTQTGANAQNIALTGTGNLTFGPLSSFGGDIASSSPALFLNGCTFNGVTNLTKTGATGDFDAGGNIFNGVSTITNSGSSWLVLGNTNPDIWNNDVTFTDNGSERLLPAWATAGNQFNGNIFVNTSGSAIGIQFCGANATATSVLAATKTIQAGATGLTAGYLYLKQFTQSGTAAINLTATGSSVFYLGPASNFGGAVTATAPDIFTQGAVYNNAVVLNKTGAGNDLGAGGNTFQGIATVNNTGTGNFVFANISADMWNNDVNFNSSGSAFIGPAWNSPGNIFNGNITVSSTGSSTGVQFCSGAPATATLSAGKTIQTVASGFSSGNLVLRQFTQLGNAAINLNLTGATTVVQVGPSSAIGGAFTVVSPRILLNGAVYYDILNVTKTGATGEWSAGGNTFNSTVTINHLGAGFFGFANGAADIYNGDVYSNNNSTERIIFGNSPVGNQFNGNIILTQTGSSVGTAFGWSATTNETMAAGKTISIGVAGFSAGWLQIERFTQLGSAPMNLSLTGNTSLTLGPSTTIDANLTSTSGSLFFNGCTFNSTVSSTKTGVSSDNSTGNNVFNGAATMTNSGGGNLVFGNANSDQFNTTATFNNTGSANIFVAFNSANNIFGGVTTFNNSPTANTLIYVSWLSAGTIFNDNIVVTSTTGQGVQFCGGSLTATTSLSAGKTISAGAAGFSAGTLLLKQFTQVGATAQNISLTGTSILTFGPSSVFAGNITSVSPTLFFNGCTFNVSVNSTKTGVTNDNSNGNNVYNGVTTMTNSGSGYLLFGNVSSDQFNTTTTFNNTGSSNIYVAYNSANNIFGGVTTFNNTPAANTTIFVSWLSAGTIFNDNIVVTSTGGQGVQFCGGNLTATATLSAGKTISTGAGGFSTGTLLLRQFTQAGATSQNISLTGTGNLTLGPSSSFGGNVTTASPALYFNGCNFNGTVTSSKTGATNDNSAGNNIFNGAFSVTNTGAGYFMTGNVSPDLWQSTATFNNLSNGQNMYIAYNSVGNIFNGDVIFNNQPSLNNLWIDANTNGLNTQYNGNISVINLNGAGVYFGSGTGTAILSSGRAISAGAAGFTSGGLIFRNFIQTGPGAAQNITTTGTSYIQYGSSSSFDGAITSSSPGLFFNGCTFNGSVDCTKTGTSNDQSTGNNIFNGASNFTDNGTGYLLMTNTTPDAYNGNVAFLQNNTGVVYPNYNGNSTYAGNLTLTSPAATAITFGSLTGTATLSGTGGQNINATGSTPAPVFTRLVVNNSGAGVTLNTPVKVSANLTLTSGLVNTTATNILTMLNGSVTAAGTALSASYVNGPMRYQKSLAGASTLNFPIGTSPDCRPVSLTVNHTSGNLYTYQAQLFNASATALAYSLPVTVTAVSGEHYYTISRVNAASVNQPTLELSGNQTIQIFFGSNDVVSDGATLSIVKNTFAATTSWIDIGGTGGPAYSGGANLTGSITSTSLPTAFNSFSTFSIANKLAGSNVLPIELLFFNAKVNKGIVNLGWATSIESNNSYFTVERGSGTADFRFLQKIGTEALGGNSSIPLHYIANDLNPYSGVSYYRLKQTDLDGNYTYSDIVPVNFDKNSFISVYPNPTRGTMYITGIDLNQNSLKIEWFDISGRSMLKETIPVQSGTATLNAQFNTGVYLLKITTSDGGINLQNVMIMK